MDNLLTEIRTCRLCHEQLPFGANPVMSASQDSKIIVVGQAPGRVVHTTGIPWNDKSGDNLRTWLNVSREQFYDTSNFALMPMGFCYPGTGKSGDLPPRKECAPLWHPQLLTQMPNARLILLVGNYAQSYYLKDRAYRNLTENVHQFTDFLPTYFPLPHPSPRNNLWQAKNQWFVKDVLPYLEMKVHAILNTSED